METTVGARDHLGRLGAVQVKKTVRLAEAGCCLELEELVQEPGAVVLWAQKLRELGRQWALILVEAEALAVVTLVLSVMVWQPAAQQKELVQLMSCQAGRRVPHVQF